MRSVYAPQTEVVAPEAPLAPVPSEISINSFASPPAEELDAAVRRFKKAIIERALAAS